MEKDFEVVPHIADLKIRAYGKDLQMLFRNALRGMFLGVWPQVENYKDVVTVKRQVEITSHDREALLVDFLSEALYLSDAHGEVYLDATIERLDDRHLKGVLSGFDVVAADSAYKADHRNSGELPDRLKVLEGEVKAVTYHQLKIEQTQEGKWWAEILFDL